MTRYSRRPAEVEAVRLDRDNADEVAAFAEGRVERNHLGAVVVHLPSTRIPVTLGDWAVRDVMPDGLAPARAMLAHLFEWCFAPTSEPRRHRRKDPFEAR